MHDPAAKFSDVFQTLDYGVIEASLAQCWKSGF